MIAAAALEGAQEGLTWIGLALCVLAGLGIVVLYALLQRLRALEQRAAELGHLPRIDAKLAELVQQPSDLDLRRLEHVLIDIRDGQRRVEARMLAVLEHMQTERVEFAGESALPGRSVPTLAGPHLADRITSRLLALGFERIEFLTRSDELAGLFEHGGDVLVEARRGGVPYKGRVVLGEGSIADVQLRPSYQIFP